MPFMEMNCKIGPAFRKYFIKIFFLLLLILPLFCLGQNICNDLTQVIRKGNSFRQSNSDSAIFFYNQAILQAELKKCDSILFKANLRKAEMYLFRSDYKTADSIAVNAQKVAKRMDYILGLGHAYNLQASILVRQNKYQEAQEIFNKAILYYKQANDTVSLAKTLGNLGVTFDYLGLYTNALESYFAALKICEGVRDTPCLASNNSNIASIYFMINDNEKALKYMKISNDLKEKFGDSTGLVIGLNNLAEALIKADQLDSVLRILHRSETISEKLDLASSLGYTYGAYGNYYLKKQEFQQAEKYFLKQIIIFEKIDAIDNLSEAKNSLTTLYIKNGNCVKASALLKEIIPTIKENLQLLIETKDALSNSLACQNNFKEAFLILKEKNFLDDSLMTIEKHKALQELETKYETEKKECVITQQNLEIKNKNMGLGLVGGGLLGAIGLATLLYRKRRQEQELNQLLDQQNRVLQDANQGLLHQLSIQRESDEVAQEPLMITLSNGSQSIVNIDDIQYFEAENNIVKIVLADGTVRHDYQRLKNFIELLKDSAMFVQIHRSYLVNVNHVTSHRANDLKMRSGDTLPIGITLKEKVHAKLKEK